MVFPDMIRHRCLERGALVVVDPNTMREGNPLPYVPCGGHGGGFFFGQNSGRRVACRFWAWKSANLAGYQEKKVTFWILLN
jgi:hypothetical protein